VSMRSALFWDSA